MKLTREELRNLTFDCTNQRLKTKLVRLLELTYDESDPKPYLFRVMPAFEHARIVHIALHLMCDPTGETPQEMLAYLHNKLGLTSIDLADIMQVLEDEEGEDGETN